MLVAKIIPAAQLVVQPTPFESTFVEADYMTALARPYALGATKVNFEVIYGNLVEVPVPDSDVLVKQFKSVTSSQITLEGPELSSWGIDDSVVLTAIAAKVGTTVVEIEVVPTNFY
jgi:hypothetical protein